MSNLTHCTDHARTKANLQTLWFNVSSPSFGSIFFKQYMNINKKKHEFHIRIRKISHAITPFSFSFRALDDISIVVNFHHVLFLDVSGNNLADITILSIMEQLLVLRADRNKLTTAVIPPMPYLQV